MNIEKTQLTALIGKYLKNIRKKKGFSQAYIATKATLSLRHYQDIEYGKRKCRIDTLAKVLSLYSLNLFNFFDSFLIDGFAETSYEKLSEMLGTNKFSCARCNCDGLFTKVGPGGAELTGYNQDEVENKMYVWDMINSDIERIFAKAVIKVITTIKPRPFPWQGEIRTKDNKVILVKGFWRYIYNEKKEIVELDLVSYCVNSAST